MAQTKTTNKTKRAAKAKEIKKYAKTAMPGAKRLNMFEADATDPRMVIVGLDETELYGERGSEKARATGCYDERAFDDIEKTPELLDLLNSMLHFGYEETLPINVLKDGDHYLVRAGRGRLRVARAVSKARGKPVRMTFIVSKGDERGSYVSKILENAHRRPWKPVEMARLITEGRKEQGLSDEELVALFGPMDIINRRLKLLDLSKPMRDKVDRGEIHLKIAERLAEWPRGEQEAQLAEMVASGLTSQAEQQEALSQLRGAKQRGETMTAADVSIVPSRSAMKRLVQRIESKDDNKRMDLPPGIAKMSPLEVIKLCHGMIPVKKVAGLTAALREVAPKKRAPAPALTEGDGPVEVRGDEEEDEDGSGRTGDARDEEE